jgi:hypothetical protein
MKTTINILAGIAAFVIILVFRQPIYQILNVIATNVLPPGLR